MIKLVAGLGNPGRKYSRTRHNLGFMVADLLAENFSSGFKSSKGDYRQSSISISGRNIIVIKPTTYMNLSGDAVRWAADYHDIEPNEILVISDDINLPLGKIRIRLRGSDGGHKGLRSIIEELETDNFSRLRLGVGLPDNPDIPSEVFVLERFGKDEEKTAKEMIENAVSAVELIISDGVQIAQQTYN
jgi:PTH1 family peptidyl-tRNA hydrolase